MKRRVAVVSALLGLWVAGIEARLVYLQVFDHADLAARAERQQERTPPSPAKRGDILDRRGRVLATSVDADTIYAVPTEIDRRRRRRDEALRRARRLRREGSAVARRAARASSARSPTSGGRSRPIRRERVAALNLDGIGFIKESKRFYPNKELAAHLLGWVGIDNTGLSGLEYTYDPQIRGKAGTILVHTDARRHAFSRFERPPTSGSSVELTIDEYLQHIAERELHAGVAREPRRRRHRDHHESAHRRDSGDGERADVQPERLSATSTTTERRNRAVQDLYEPGSTFKVVTASAAHRREGDADRHDRSTPAAGRSGSTRPRSSTTRTTTACCRSPTSSSSRATSARSRSASSSAPSG